MGTWLNVVIIIAQAASKGLQAILKFHCSSSLDYRARHGLQVRDQKRLNLSFELLIHFAIRKIMLKLSGTADKNEILHKVASLKMVYRNKNLARMINISVMQRL